MAGCSVWRVGSVRRVARCGGSLSVSFRVPNSGVFGLGSGIRGCFGADRPVSPEFGPPQRSAATRRAWGAAPEAVRGPCGSACRTPEFSVSGRAVALFRSHFGGFLRSFARAAVRWRGEPARPRSCGGGGAGASAAVRWRRSGCAAQRRVGCAVCGGGASAWAMRWRRRTDGSPRTTSRTARRPEPPPAARCPPGPGGMPTRGRRRTRGCRRS